MTYSYKWNKIYIYPSKLYTILIKNNNKYKKKSFLKKNLFIK